MELIRVFFDKEPDDWELKFCERYEVHRQLIYDATVKERYLNNVFRELWQLTRESTQRTGKRQMYLRDLADDKFKSMVRCAKSILADQTSYG